jgi:hypothetical protein
MTSILKWLCNNSRFLFSLLSFFFVLNWVTSCDDPDLNNFETPLNQNSYLSTVTDTTTLIIRTIQNDSTITNGLTKDLIGSYFDKTIGFVKASVYSEFRPLSYSMDFGTSPVLDSAVLTLKFVGGNYYFGNPGHMMWLDVFQLSKRIYVDSVYKSNTVIPYNTTKIGTWIGYPAPASGTLKIRLSNDFGDKIINANPLVLASPDGFADLFSGIAVIPTGLNPSYTPLGAIIDFLFTDVSTTIKLFYNHSDSATFYVTDDCARFSRYEHKFDYSSLGQIIGKDTNNVVLAPLCGTKVSIQIPYLRNLVKSGQVVIHQAELILPVDSSSPYFEDAYRPTSLLLLKSDAAGQLYNIADRTEPHYNGKLNVTKGYFTFGLTRHIQNLVQQYYQDSLYHNPYTLNLIIPTDNPITATPLILKNISQGKRTIKLKLVYSKL